MKKLVLSLLALASFGVNIAQEKVEKKESEFSRWKVRARIIGVAPNEKSTVGIIGGDANISNDLVPELDFTYFFTKNIAAELILGTTKHDVKTLGSDLSAIGGPTSATVDLGSVRLLPPTLTLQYHFNQANNNVFKPYIGAGVNYTLFYDVKSGNTVKNVEYKNTIGYAAQIGFDLMLNEKFFINADVKRLFLKTDVTVDASNLATGLSIPASVTIDPWIMGMGFGMKF